MALALEVWRMHLIGTPSKLSITLFVVWLCISLHHLSTSLVFLGQALLCKDSIDHLMILEVQILVS